MIFVDESIQHDLGYICVGFAYCSEPPDLFIRDAIRNVGLSPGIDEYKSGDHMRNSAERRALREAIFGIALGSCKFGVYVASVYERPTLLSDIVNVAEKIVLANGLVTPQDVMVDNGILGPKTASNIIKLTSNCNSKTVLGIQLADFVAYHCSLLLKTELVGKSKQIRVIAPHHPLDGEYVDLDWMIRTDIRRNFFAKERNVHEILGDDWTYQVSDFGCFWSPNLSVHIAQATSRVFGEMYFGCVW